MSVQTAVARVVLYGTEQATQAQINQHLVNSIELITTNDNFPPEKLDFLGKFNLLLYNRSLTTAEDLERLYQTCHLCRDASVPVVLLSQSIESDTLISAYREGLADCCMLPTQLSSLNQLIDMQIKKAVKTDRSLLGFIKDSLTPLDYGMVGTLMPGMAAMMSAPAPSAAAADGCTLHAQFFGIFKVFVKGKEITMPSASKVRSLLAWLLLNKRSSIHRDRLARVFWVDLDVKSARNNLSVTLTHLRRAFLNQQLDCDLIVLKGDCYQLNPCLSISSDMEQYNRTYEEVRQHLVQNRNEDVARRYHRMTSVATFEFLEDLQREHWTAKHRDDFREKNSDALYWLSQYYLERNDYESAIESLKKGLMIDDCQEDLHLKLAMCYMALGKPQRAHQQKEICARILFDKLDIERLSRKWDELLK